MTNFPDDFRAALIEYSEAMEASQERKLTSLNANDIETARDLAERCAQATAESKFAFTQDDVAYLSDVCSDLRQKKLKQSQESNTSDRESQDANWRFQLATRLERARDAIATSLAQN